MKPAQQDRCLLGEDFFHLEEKKKRSREFRRKWVPAFKTILSSLADVVGDWVFFTRIKNGDDAFNYLEKYLEFFCIVSTILGCFSVFSILMNNCVCLKQKSFEHKEGCLKMIGFLLGLEMFFEDIPQVILTYLVMKERNGGEWSPVGVFNLTTSMFNFTFNILDMLMPLDEVHHDEKEQKVQEKYQQHTGMAVEDDSGNSGNYYVSPPEIEPVAANEQVGSGTSQEETETDEHKEREFQISQSQSTTSANFDQLKEKILSEGNDNDLQQNILPSNNQDHIV